MSDKPILVVLAAGMGRRFGSLKQITAFGPHGEGIIDYSLFDAIAAGFERVIFVVNHRIKDDFRSIIGCHVEKRMDVRYVCQELDCLPDGCPLPKERVRPWGTGHAALCCAPYIDAPFAVINGDDLYGRHAMKEIFAFLTSGLKSGQHAMVGYELSNTVTRTGFVSRGICVTDERGMLQSVTERVHIVESSDGPLFTEDMKNYTLLPRDTIVSMNLWGFAPDFAQDLQAYFPAFYQEALKTDILTREYFLPYVVTRALESGRACVRVLTSPDRWYGVTNAADSESVKQAIAEMTRNGVYPDGLWL